MTVGKRGRTFLAVAWTWFVAGAAASDADSWAQIIVEQTRAGAPMPVLSAYDPELDLDAAYGIQRAYVELALGTRRLGGYKAGFTAAAGRDRFGLDGPIAGVLFADGILADGAVIDRGAFGNLVVELEIGFVLRSRITRRMRSVEDLKTYVAAALPAIELPDLHYDDTDRLRGVDVVATNVASRHYLAGAPFALTDLAEVDDLSARLYRDDTLLDEGHARNALGSQLQALLWLVNTVHELGWPLEPGQLLLTGTLGRINPGEPGAYRADYGRGEVRFTVTGKARAAQAPK